MFDLYRIKVTDQTGATASFLASVVTGFSIICSTEFSIEWSKFSDTRLIFREEKCALIEVVDYPETIHLEVTRNCNLTCYMCREGRGREIKEIGINNLDLQIFDKMIPFMQNVVSAAFFGWGEPLCHPDFGKFIDSVSLIKDRNHPKLLKRINPSVSFTTNATLLTENLIGRIIKSGLDEIVLSIDSSNQDNYNFIRKGADFKNVMNNLCMLQKVKAKEGALNPTLRLQFVAMRRNIKELPGMIKFAVDLGIKTVIVNYIVVVTKGLEQESLYYHQKLANRVFDETEKIAQSEGISISLPQRFGTKVDPQGFCNEVQEMFYVKAEGTVISCCSATDVIIGDLYEETPEEIWQGKRRKKILDNLNKGVLEGKCKGCYKFTGNDINLRETHIKV